MQEFTFKESHETCKSTTKKHAEHLYLATRFLPLKKREGVQALFTFHHFINEGADPVLSALEKQAHLKKCNELIERIYGSKTEEFLYPFEKALEQTLLRYEIPKKLTQDMLAGMVLKSHFRQPRTEDELLAYAAHSTGTLFQMILLVVGSTKEVTKQATALGTSEDLLHIALRPRQLFQSGKLYYPQAWLEEQGLRESDVLKLGQIQNVKQEPEWMQKFWNIHSRIITLSARICRDASSMTPHLTADGSRMFAAALCAHNQHVTNALLKEGPYGIFRQHKIGLWDRFRILTISRHF